MTNTQQPQWPIGTRVKLTEDDGRITVTHTRSASWDLCGSWVVKVRGKAGGYLQSRMVPVQSEAQQKGLDGNECPGCDGSGTIDDGGPGPANCPDCNAQQKGLDHG